MITKNLQQRVANRCEMLLNSGSVIMIQHEAFRTASRTLYLLSGEARNKKHDLSISTVALFVPRTRAAPGIDRIEWADSGIGCRYYRVPAGTPVGSPRLRFPLLS